MTIPNSVTSIADFAFYGCGGLNSVAIPNSVTSIGRAAFYECSALTSVTIPNSVTSIGYGAFYSCSALTSVTIPNSVISIGDYAFYECSALTSATIPNSVTSIGYGAFAYCSALPSVTIPESVTSIGDFVFYECSNLQHVESLATTPPELGNYVFDAAITDNVPLIVPGESIAAYKSDAQWGKFKRIVGNGMSYFETTIDGNLYYAYQPGEVRLYQSDNTLCLNIPEKIEYEGNQYSVVGIDSKAVAPTLVSVSIPASVSELENGLFNNCSSLVKVFLNGKTVPEGLADAFSAVAGRETYVPVADYEAYSSILGNVNVYSRVASKFEQGGVTYIQQASSRTAVAVDYDYDTDDVVIPATVSNKGVELQVVAILPKTFASSPMLTGLTIAEGTEPLEIRESFADLNIQTLEIGRPVTSAQSPFAGMASLVDLTVCGNVTKVNAGDFARCSNLSTVTTSGGVAEIEAAAFEGFTSLTKVSLAGNNMVIGSGAFSGCTGLTEAVMGDGVVTIGDYAFSGCSGLERFIVSATVENIGLDAFEDCSGMRLLRSFAIVPPHCDNRALAGIDKDLCSLSVPSGLINVYGSADQWKDFYHIERFDAGYFVTAIELSSETATLTEGETMQLTATISPETALDKDVDWRSSDTEVATVDENGLVTAVSAGEADIIATSKDGSNISASCHLTVTPAEILYSYSIDTDEIANVGITNIPISMKNDADVTSLQCDIYLPEGLTVVTNEYGDYDITKGARLDNTFVVASSNLNGAVRVAIYSTQNHAVNDNDGVIFYLPVRLADESTPVGTEYVVEMTESYATLLPGLNEVSLPDLTHTMVVAQAYTPGDVNNDGKYSIADVSITVSYLLGHEPANGIREAADVNGDNRISVADVSIIVSYLLTGKTINAPVRIVAADNAATATEQSEISINDNGNLMLRITNLDNYISAQADITLPDGLKVKGVRMTGANADTHTVVWSMTENGDLRIVAYSPYNSNFRDGDSFVEVMLERKSSVEASQITAQNILMTEVLRDNAGDIFAEASAQDAFAWIDLSSVDMVGNGSKTVTINGHAYDVTPDKEGKVIFTDTQGRVYRINVMDNEGSIDLAPGIYLVNNKKIFVK